MKKVVFDLDDTLWNLNERAAEILNIDYSKLDTFIVGENNHLTEEEKEKLIKLYSDPYLWKDMKLVPGAKLIKQLENYKAEVYINSNCMNEEVQKYKRSFLSDLIGLPDERIILNISSATHKPMDDDIFILVDDSPFNIQKSNAKYNIIPNKPWNQHVKADFRFNTLEDIIDWCKILLIEG